MNPTDSPSPEPTVTQTVVVSDGSTAAHLNDLNALVWVFGLVGLAALCVLVFLVAVHVFGRLAS